MLLSNTDELVKHIRNCFLSSDQSGAIESLINSLDDEDNDHVCPSSPPVNLKPDIITTPRAPGVITRYTSQKNVTSGQISAVSFDQSPWTAITLSPNKCPTETLIVKPQSSDNRRRSMFSSIVKRNPDNRFSTYARFRADASTTSSNPNKQRDGFVELAICFPSSEPVRIKIFKTATVNDVIGLAFLEYTSGQEDADQNQMGDNKIAATTVPAKTNRIRVNDLLSGKLTENDFCLRFADDISGEYDDDFPALERNELIGQFDFPFLAIVLTTEDSTADELQYDQCLTSYGDVVIDAYDQTAMSSVAETSPQLGVDSELGQEKDRATVVMNAVYMRPFKSPVAAKIEMGEKYIKVIYQSSKGIYSSSFSINLFAKSRWKTLDRPKSVATQQKQAQQVINSEPDPTKLILVIMSDTKVTFSISGKLTNNRHVSFQFCVNSDDYDGFRRRLYAMTKPMSRMFGVY